MNVDRPWRAPTWAEGPLDVGQSARCKVRHFPILMAPVMLSWAVLGTIGFLGATVHYVVGSPQAVLQNGIAGWSPPVAFACLGFWIVLLGLLGRRRSSSARRRASSNAT